MASPPMLIESLDYAPIAAAKNAGPVVPSIAVAWASAATANHLLIDMVIGVVVVGVAYLAARRWPLADVFGAARRKWRMRGGTP